MWPFHRHKWTIADKQFIRGKIMDIEEARGSVAETILEMARDKYIYIFTCKCGKYRIEKVVS